MKIFSKCRYLANNKKNTFLRYSEFINLIFNFFYRPQQLELTAVNEMVLMENINVFQMNGFDFHFQQDGKFYLFLF